MRRNTIIIDREAEEMHEVNQYLADGFVCDPAVGGKPIVCGGFIVYHLIKFDSPEEQSKYGDVIGVKSVDMEEANELLKQGWEIVELFSKTVTMVLRKKQKEKKEPEEASMRPLVGRENDV